MNNAHQSLDFETKDQLARLCAEHLQRELTTLEKARRTVASMKQSFAHGGAASLFHMDQEQREVEAELSELGRCRDGFRQAIHGLLAQAGDEFRLSEVIRLCAPSAQSLLMLDLVKARRLANELVADHHWVAVHLQIFHEAYGSLLRECIGDPTQSSRYGRNGKRSTDEYRPLLEIMG